MQYEKQLKIIMSKRMRPLATFKGYIFNIRTINNSIHNWRCKIRSCEAKLTTNNEHEILRETSHNHPFIPGEVEALVIKDSLNALQFEKNITFEEGFVRLVTNCSNDAIKELPKYSSLRDVDRKKRNLIANYVKTEFDEIPETFKKNLNNENFLMYNSGHDNANQIIIFYSVRNLEILKRSKIWLSDGTFRVAPKPFTQLFTVHAYIFKMRFPVIYCLMKKKNNESYKEFFLHLKCILGDFEPNYIVFDFEVALRNMFGSVFKHTKMFGCFFHFCQLIWRTLQENNLSSLYKTNVSFRTHIKHIIALCFVPPHLIDEYVKEILKGVEDELRVQFTVIFDFFEKNYLCKFNDESINDYKFWSVFARILENCPRTTNSVEAWHRHVNNANIVPHPNICKLIEFLQRNEKIVNIKYQRALNGQFDYRTAYFKKESQLFNIVTNWTEYSKHEYLGIVANFCEINTD